MKHLKRAVKGIILLLLCLCFGLMYVHPTLIVLSLTIFGLFVWLVVKPASIENTSKRLKNIYYALELLSAYAWSLVLEIPFLIILLRAADIPLWGMIVYSVMRLMSGAVIMIISVVRLVVSSARLGILTKLFLIFMWWIPVFNIAVAARACMIAGREYELETQRNELFAVRSENEICKTKYPILMVHGVFFRDTKYLNYWGRIPQELIRNGAQIYYGNQQSAASVKDSGKELLERIRQIVKETGCEKVNIIAHSKGGLDSRYAISMLGGDEYVASLTTVNTPHRGCAFADDLLGKAPSFIKKFVAFNYNSTLKKLGDKSPDFIAAVSDLTQQRCLDLNNAVYDKPGVFYQSVGSVMRSKRSAKLVLRFTYRLVGKYSSAANDGLVDVESMKWGESFELLQPQTKRGISHGDMIDLLREDIPKFDVREAYVQIVQGLKAKGF